MGEETTIMGTVLSVVFQNEENGYAVLRLVTDDGELLTLVGCVPCAAPGENLTATGSFSSHPQYGEQFSASEVERYLPSNETEILNYLASGVVRGVGPATAEKLVARFGIETLQVLESEPEKLTAIKGMTARRAQEISAAFNEQMGLRRVMEFLAHYDLPAALSVPLYRRFGANAMAALERNPYLCPTARSAWIFPSATRSRSPWALAATHRSAPGRGSPSSSPTTATRADTSSSRAKSSSPRRPSFWTAMSTRRKKASTISSPSTASCRKASRM